MWAGSADQSGSFLTTAAMMSVTVSPTKAGLPAIEEMIARGRNINVTLIFSLQRYAEVAEAYIKGLERLVTGSVVPQPDRGHVDRGDIGGSCGASACRVVALGTAHRQEGQSAGRGQAFPPTVAGHVKSEPPSTLMLAPVM